MSLILRLAALSALLAATPATADMTARYRAGETVMTMRVNDRGDARSDVTDAAYLTRDGIDYLVVPDARGDYVVRLDDFAALMAELMAATGTARPAARLIIVDAGTETVAGRSGRLYRVHEEGRPHDAFEAVVATDADLAPLARAQARHFGQMIEAATISTPGLGAALRDLMNGGLLLRLMEIWRLDSVDTDLVAPALFALPAAPIDRAELRRRFGLRANP